MTKEELIEKRASLLKEKKDLQKKLADPKAEAKAVSDLIFKKRFVAGGKWIETTKRKGRQNMMAAGFLGGVRHVFGHLHTDEGMHAAMDRLVVNSIIQGPASNLGFIGGFLTKKMIWDYYESRGISLGIKIINAVHDATYFESRYVNIPLANYLFEHGQTTLLHKWMRDVIGYAPNMSFETDCVVGPSLAEMYESTRWDDQVVAIQKGLEWKRDNLGLKQPIEKIMKIVKHNAEIIFEIRRKEILHQLKNEIRVGYDMTLNYDNALSFDLIFENPVEEEVKRTKSWMDEK